MNNKKRKELKVSALENGTVIDHIPQGNVLKVIRILNLENFEDQIYFGANLDSKKYGKKGLIKISNRFFESEDLNKIALVAPTATLTVIKDYQVVEKKNVEIPNQIAKFIKCVNPNCITNVENVPTKFKVISKDDLQLRCHYCEKITAKNNMTFK